VLVFPLIVVPAFVGAPQQPERATPSRHELRELVRQCDRIVEGEIVELEHVSVGIRDADRRELAIATLHVRETIWSDSKRDSLYVLLPQQGITAALTESASGGIWFLRHSEMPYMRDREQHKKLLEQARPAGIQEPTIEGLGWIPVRREGLLESVLLPEFIADPKAGVPPLRGETGSAALSRDDFRRMLTRAIEAETPRVTARLLSSGPIDPRVSIGPDGKCLYRSGKDNEAEVELPLSSGEFARLLEVVTGQEFWALPRSVGDDRAPHSAVGVIEVRKASGIKLVNVMGLLNRTDASHEDVRAIACALSVWDAIPNTRDWGVTSRR